jgi:hypothetical protein
VSCCVFATCSQSEIAGKSLAISHLVPTNKYHSNYSVRRPAVQASEYQCQHPALVPIWQRDPFCRQRLCGLFRQRLCGPFRQRLYDPVRKRLYDIFRKRLSHFRKCFPHFSIGGCHWSSALPDCRRWSRSWDGHVWIARCFVGEYCYFCTLLDTSKVAQRPMFRTVTPALHPTRRGPECFPSRSSSNSSCEVRSFIQKTWHSLSVVN